MILIGNSDDNLIVTLTRDEFANLMDLHSKYDLEKKHVKVGFEYDISKVYQQLKCLQANKHTFKKIHEYLGKIQSSLELTKPYVVEITEDQSEE